MLRVEHRASASPYVARVWRGHAVGVERMMSVAVSTWELVMWRHQGRLNVAARGPESSASTAEVPDGATSLGIAFSHGTWMPHLSMARLVDDQLDSPHVTDDHFALRGESWRLPTFDGAEDFVTGLVRAGLLVRDPLVGKVVAGEPVGVATRTVQRRVSRATGLTQAAIRQIERARQAAILLADGVPTTDVVHGCGYHDQPHLARSLRRFIGRTATQLRRGDHVTPLSLLYKTGP